MNPYNKSVKRSRNSDLPSLMYRINNSELVTRNDGDAISKLLNDNMEVKDRYEINKLLLETLKTNTRNAKDITIALISFNAEGEDGEKTQGITKIMCFSDKQMRALQLRAIERFFAEYEYFEEAAEARDLQKPKPKTKEYNEIIL